MEQLTLDLWPTEVTDSPAGRFVEWAQSTHGCDDSIIPYVERAYDMFGNYEAFDRCKVLTVLNGVHRVDGYGLNDTGILGVYDATIDYHTCWDRAWAVKAHVDKHLIARIKYCDYRRTYDPVFYDFDGNRIASGHIPTAREVIACSK